MSLRDDFKQLKTDARSLRKFGWLVGGVLAALGLWFWLRHKPAFPYFVVPGVLLIVIGSAAPRRLRHVYLAWMTLALVLGFIASHVLLTLFFLLVITPVGLLARLVGKDFLRLKQDRNAATYWIRREPATRSRTDHERQF